MSLTSEVEQRLVAQAQASKSSEREQAFREIFDALRSQVFAICLQVTGTRADAEDAVQESFIGVYQGLARFRGESRLSTWVHRIAVRTALSVRARRGRGQLDLDAASEVPSPTSTPEQAAHDRKELLRLREALESISDEHRVVLSLFAVDGLGHDDIAEILGVPAGTVWSRLHLARKRLGTAMGRSATGQ